MSLFPEITTRSRRHGAQYAEEPPHRSGDLVVYKKEPSSTPHRHRNRSRHRKDPLIVRSRSLHRRASSSDEDDRRRSRRKSMVVRPRSASRVRIAEPALLVDTSSSCSSSDEGRRRRRHKHRGGDTHIRATSRPGKRNEYAFVRHPTKSRRKSDARSVVQDIKLETEHQHRDFRHRRDDLENREAAVLIRSRSREREGFGADDSDRDDYYSKRRQRSSYAGGSHRRRRSVDDDRRHLGVAPGDRSHQDRGRDFRDPYHYGHGSSYGGVDDERGARENRYGPRQRHFSLSPDRESAYSGRGEGSVRGALSTTSKPSRSHDYEDSIIGSETRPQPPRDSPYMMADDRRVKEREREAIEREERALRREEAALSKEKRLAGREMDLPFRDVEKDARKYYKTGSGLFSTAKKMMG